MDSHQAFLESLQREETQLLALRDLLYEGSWDEMVIDLKARKAGRPHVFQLETRIDEDLARIARLRAYEVAEGVDLGETLDRMRVENRAPEKDGVPERDGTA